MSMIWSSFRMTCKKDISDEEFLTSLKKTRSRYDSTLYKKLHPSNTSILEKLKSISIYWYVCSWLTAFILKQENLKLCFLIIYWWILIEVWCTMWAATPNFGQNQPAQFYSLYLILPYILKALTTLHNLRKNLK